MTASGSPGRDEDEPEQEGIWEDLPPAESRSAELRATAPTVAPAGVGRSQGLTQSITSTERVPGPAGLLLADVPNRILALVLDIIILSIVGFGLAWLFGGLVNEAGALDSAGRSLDIVAFMVVLVLQAVISLAYFVGFWTLSEATPGMRLLGLRVGDESDARPIGVRPAVLRWLILGIPCLLASLIIYVPDAIGVLLGAVGAVWLLLLLYSMAKRPTKQGLQDRVAHSIVVRNRRRAA